MTRSLRDTDFGIFFIKEKKVTQVERIENLGNLLTTRTYKTINTMATISVIEDVYHIIRNGTPADMLYTVQPNLDCLVVAAKALMSMSPNEESFNKTMKIVFENLDGFLRN